MNEQVDQIDQEDPLPLPKGFVAVKKSNGAIPLPKGFEEVKKKVSLGSLGSKFLPSGEKVGGLLSGSDSEEKKILTNAITQTTFKKNEKPFDQTREDAVTASANKLNEIMFGEGDEWKDPIKAANNGLKKSETNQEAAANLGAKTLTTMSLAPTGTKARQVLATSHFKNEGDDNETAKLLKDRVAKYDKVAQPFRDLGDVNYEDERDFGTRWKIYDAAIKAYANKSPAFKKQAEAAGIDLNGENILLSMGDNNAKVGQIVETMLRDEDFADFVNNENPNILPSIKKIADDLIYDNKDYGKAQLANEISREIQNSGYNKIDPIFNFEWEAKKTGEAVAQSLYGNDPRKKQFYEENKDEILNMLDAPSFFEGFASSGKDIGKGIIKTFTEPFTPISETIKNSWEKEASAVNADPQGAIKYIRDVGHASGLVSSIIATGNVTGIANPKTAGALATGLGFFGDQLEIGKVKYPDRPFTAWGSAVLNTGMYVALSYDLLPKTKSIQAFEKVKPELSNVIENLTAKKITIEQARKEAQTLTKTAIDFAGGTLSKSAKISADMGAVAAIDTAFDKIEGLDEETFEQYHPDDQIAQTLSHTFFTFAPVTAVGKFGAIKRGNKIVEESLYTAATNPKRFDRVIDELEVKDPSINIKELKDNLKFLTETKADLDARGIDPKNQRRYLFEAMSNKVKSEALSRNPDANIIRKGTEEVREHQETADRILDGVDVVGEQEKQIIEENPPAIDQERELDRGDEKISQPTEVIEKNTWHRGVNKNNKDQGDKFYSADESTAHDYAIDKVGEEPTMTKLSKEELPKNPLIVGAKEELAEMIGFPEENIFDLKGDFDKKAKEYAQSKGHDAIVYESGSMDNPEMHIFEKPSKQTTNEANTQEGVKEKTKQENINDLMDDVAAFNKMAKNTKGRSYELNQLKIRANDLGLRFDDTRGRLFNENGKRVMKISTDKPSSLSPDFNDADYSPETKQHIETLSKNTDALLGLPIMGNDGRQLSISQIEGALQSVKDGKPSRSAKSVHDFIEDAVQSGEIQLVDKVTGQNVKVPVNEYFDLFKEPTKELTDAEIEKLNFELTEDSFNFKDEYYAQERLHQETEQPSPEGTIPGQKKTGSGQEGSGINPKEKVSGDSKETTEIPKSKPTIESSSEQELVTEATSGTGEPPKPPTDPPEAKPEGGRKGRLNDKGILNHLHEATGVPQEAKDGFEREGLRYETKSQKEAESVAKNVIEFAGMEEALALAEAQKFDGDVNSMIFAESLNRLAEQSDKAATPEEKLALDTRFKEVGLAYDKAARSGGRFSSAINHFYKKSPLGIVMIENEKRKQEFTDWSKPKDKSWKEFFEELRKEPEFDAIIKEQVKEGVQEERKAAREARKKKVDEFFDKAKDEFKGGALYSTVIPPKVITAALEGMRQAYHAGERVAELIEKAVDYISDQLGTSVWDKEKFRKEWGDKLKEKEGKKPLTDEEVKTKILDKFRKKLKGLSDKERDEVIRKSFARIVESGGLDYVDFRDIIGQVTGRTELTTKQVERLKELVKITNSIEDAAQKAREERTPEALANFRKTQDEAGKAAKELQEMFGNKPDIVRRLTSIMQLNTLGIVSLVNNPIYNIWNQATLRFPIGIINDSIDRFGKRSEQEYNVWETQGEFWNKLGLGSAESMKQLFTGLNRMDYIQKEIQTDRIRPAKSWRDIIAKIRGKKKMSPAETIDKILQGTAGVSAEIVARLLNIGDKPQRFAAEGSQAAAFAKALGLKGMDYKLFIEFPREEAYNAYKALGYSDAVAGEKADYVREAMIKEGQRSTFQQDNLFNDFLTRAFGVFGGKDSGTATLLKTLTVSPYIKIPSNAFWSFYNLLNPEIALLQSMVHKGRSTFYKGKGEYVKQKMQNREARYWFGHAMVGMASRAVVLGLLQSGALSVTPSSDDDESKKERDATSLYNKAGSVKIGNMNVSLRWWGQAGMLFNSMAKKHQDQTPEQKENQDFFWSSVLGGMEREGLEELQNGLFANSSSLLQWVDGGSPDRYVTNSVNMMANIIQPASVAQYNRANIDEVPNARGDNLLEKINNQFAQRSPLYRNLTNTHIEKKLDIWGSPIPKGGNVLSRMLGVSKADTKQFGRPIYEDAVRTGDSGFLPPAVLPTLNGEKLKEKQYQDLQNRVGTERKNLIAPYVNNMATFEGYNVTYRELNDADKKFVLQYLYGEGRERGVEKFYQDYPELKPKKEEKDYNQEAKEELFKILTKYKNK